MSVAGGNDALSPAHAAQGGSSLKAQFPSFGGNQVGNLMGFKVAPHVFHRIEFWGIGGKSLHLDSAMGRENIVPDQYTAVNGRPVPDHQDFPGNVALQMPQKLDDLKAFNAAGVDLEVEPPEGQAADDRKALPVEGLLENGSLSAKRPGARPRRTGAQAAFINKDYGATLLPGLFFKAGHSTRCHFRMAFSFRSTARRSGRWQLKPLAPSKRQTCPG